MNPDVKAKWLEALRSGEYEQGEGYLDVTKTDEATGEKVRTFCCLGVLCDIAVAEGVIPAPDRVFASRAYYDGDEDAFLPIKVQEWSGVNGEGTIPGESIEIVRARDNVVTHENALIAVNDSGVPFTKIADLIEERF